MHLQIMHTMTSFVLFVDLFIINCYTRQMSRQMFCFHILLFLFTEHWKIVATNFGIGTVCWLFYIQTGFRGMGDME